MYKDLKIGLSACFFHADPLRPIFKGKTLQYVEQSIAHWVMSSGAKVYMIPSIGASTPYNLKKLTDIFDGLVLQGGSDVSPLSYKEKPLRPEWSGDFVRDQYEIELVKCFTQSKRPILGICRGLQLLNVAFGGTLYQDIETQTKTKINHRNWEIYDQNFHSITLEKKCHLAKIYSSSKYKVNSIHHQAIKDLAPKFKVQARSTNDKIIEAIKLDAAQYVMAVQWHPEFQTKKDKDLISPDPLLKDFLNAILARKK